MTSFGQKNLGSTKSPYDFSGVTTKPPPSSYKQMQSRAGGKPLGTGAQGGPQGRPLTSNKGMGFTSKNLQNKANQLLNTKTKFDVNKKVETNPEENFKKMQKQINQLIEESANCKLRGSFTQALEKAKQAVNKEKNLRKARESANVADMINLDLSYCVLFNHAVSLEANGMIQQALTKYTEIIKSKQFPQAGRLRVNMGNIYFQQKKYPIAIKMYRMALDIIPTTSKQMRFKILKNIGHAFIKLGQFQQAITSYQNIMKGSPDHKTAFNLLLCLYASGDKLRMKDCFSSMLFNENEQQQQNEQDDDNKNTNDKLKQENKERRREELRLIILASKLIAPVIQNDIIQSYDWILEKLKTSSYPQAESEVEIFKALALLKKKQIDKAIESLKTLQKKDSVTMGRVASNISFLHFLQNDYKSAEKYVDMALTYDRYNAKALVNKGNCLFMKNDFMRAKQQYLEAIGVQADCVQALYNLGYVNKKLNLFMEALQALQKLQTIITIPQAIFQIANIQQIIGNTKQALKWYQVLVTKVPNDAGTLARIGNIFFRDDDQQQALHYYMESYRLLPTNIDTNIWLGIYYVKQGVYEKACHYLQRASQIQPKQVKWRLMVASCQRRIGNFQKALKIYENIYQQYPDNIQCLRFLVLLCKDMGRDYQQYAKQLSQLQLDNAARAGYENPDVQELNNNEQQRQQQEESKVNIRFSEKNTRRIQQQIKKVPKQDEGWGDDIDADAMGLS